MKVLSIVVPVAFAAGLAVSAAAFAQQPPAGSTGLCKDGTYTSNEKKRGACRGHGGVKDWYATSGAAANDEAKSSKSTKAAATESTMPAAAPAEHTQKTASAKASTGMRAQAAPGGGAGKVWLNTGSNVYHCQGDEWYGKTKAGEYMSEAEAKAKGAHAARGKACG